MAAKKNTAFDKYVRKQKKNPEFAAEYKRMGKRLKSLAEIAFDAFQCFSNKKLYHVKKNKDGSFITVRAKYKDLSSNQKRTWERVAGRVEAEIAIRTHDKEYQPPKVI